MCEILQYIHRCELPCDEIGTTIYKEKIHWTALGDSVPFVLNLDEEDGVEQCMNPSAVREAIHDTDILKCGPADQEDHYHRLVFSDLINKLDGVDSGTPSGEWFFKFGYLDDGQIVLLSN